MLVPIRCFTCGNLIADKFEDFQHRVKSGKNSAEVLDSLEVKRYCCRRMFLTTIETIQQIVPFYEAIYKRNVSIQSELE
uniref:DNA-directed RNA polymerase subunit Rpo10 n=1 Tax=uncultured marine thaumarchaeote KM3_144_G01 TaxID=1456010 RepID=A0A075GI21_9ARCH|nr:RNA polymerase, N/8 Kd subunit (rpoN) [uncultured marine thaumarchaeote KM3_144_G01]